MFEASAALRMDHDLLLAAVAEHCRPRKVLDVIQQCIQRMAGTVDVAACDGGIGG